MQHALQDSTVQAHKRKTLLSHGCQCTWSKEKMAEAGYHNEVECELLRAPWTLSPTGPSSARRPTT
eukprot:9500911-Pyramimonas_sp.AAC.1